jgi:hypothetical protein
VLLQANVQRADHALTRRCRRRCLSHGTVDQLLRKQRFRRPRIRVGVNGRSRHVTTTMASSPPRRQASRTCRTASVETAG